VSKRFKIEDSEASAAPNELVRWKADTGLTGTKTCETCKVTMPIAEFTSRRYHRSSWSHKQCLPCWDKAKRAATLAGAQEIATAYRNINARRKTIKGQAAKDGHSGKYKGATSRSAGHST